MNKEKLTYKESLYVKNIENISKIHLFFSKLLKKFLKKLQKTSKNDLDLTIRNSFWTYFREIKDIRNPYTLKI
jgi:hypothetical protein